MRIWNCWLATAMLAAANMQPLLAQDYPDKTIRIIVPYAPGGTADMLARTIGQKMAESLGRQVIIDNRPGAGGNIGADFAAKAAPDGYTILMGTVATHAINPILYPNMPYDAARDFAPIVLVATLPNLLVVNPSVPARNVRELVALAQSKPGTLAFASAGNGTSQHLSGELFKKMTGGHAGKDCAPVEQGSRQSHRIARSQATVDGPGHRTCRWHTRATRRIQAHRSAQMGNNRQGFRRTGRMTALSALL